MITGKGIGFLIIAILVFFLARVTQVGWLYLVDAVLWGIILLSAVLPWFGVGFLAAKRKVSFPHSAQNLPGPAEGDPVTIELTLRNRAFWPRFFFNTYYECPLAEPDSQQLRFFIVDLDGSGQVSLESNLTAYRRGLRRLGPIQVESSIPFGLFRCRTRLPDDQTVLVCPKVYPLRRLPLVDGMIGMSAQSQKSRVGVDAVGSRPYFPGDPRRHLHWRNTARVGKPMVREFEDPQDQTLCLLFDATQNWGAGREATLEYSIKIAASCANYALRRQAPARLWGGNLQGDHLETAGSGGSSWPELLRRLAAIKEGEGASLTDALRQIPPGSNVIATVSAADQQSIKALVQAAPTMNHLVVIALEGFGEPPPSEDALLTLERRVTSLVRCRAGQLPEALLALEQTSETARIHQVSTL